MSTGWKVKIKISLRKDGIGNKVGSPFRNNRIVPLFKRLGIERDTTGEFSGAAKPGDFTKVLNQVLSELADPTKRGDGIGVQRATLKKLSLEISSASKGMV